MAIAFDANGVSAFDTSGSVTSVSYTHTVGAGSNPFLLLHAVNSAFSGSGIHITSITCNGSAANVVGPLDAININLDGLWINTEIWYVKGAGIVVGANTLQFNYSGISNDAVYANSISYTGVHQTSPIDSHAVTSDDVGASNHANIATTVVAANGWLAGLCIDGGTRIPVGGSGASRLAAAAANWAVDYRDSNGVVAAGAEGFTWSTSPDAFTKFAFVGAVSIAPAAAAGLTRTISLGTV